MPAEQVQRPGQQNRAGFGSGDEEREDVVAAFC
jgi:hypothetical protein